MSALSIGLKSKFIAIIVSAYMLVLVQVLMFCYYHKVATQVRKEMVPARRD